MTLRHELNVNIRGSLAKGGRRVQPPKRQHYELNGSILTRYKSKQNAKVVWERDVVGWSVKSHGKHGMVLEFNNTVLILYAKSASEWSAWLSALKLAANHRLENYYAFESKIGEGGFAKVYKGYCKETGELVAIKSIDKSASESKYLSREVAILKSLNSPHVCSVHEVFETNDKLHLVLQYMGGGSLFQYLQDTSTKLSENDSRLVMKQIFEGVSYLHNQGVAHRDIKPENILLPFPGVLDGIRLADFGLSRFHQQDSLMRTMIGTPEFAAVEILRDEQYSFEVDFWSCGVILYNLITGRLPFEADEVLDSFATREILVPFEDKEWSMASPDAQQLTRQLLCTNQNARVSAVGALASPWFHPEVIPRASRQNVSRNCAAVSSFGIDRKYHSRPIRGFDAKLRWRVAILCIRVLIRTKLLKVDPCSDIDSSVDLIRTESDFMAESEWDFSQDEYECSSRAMSFASQSSVSSARSHAWGADFGAWDAEGIPGSKRVLHQRPSCSHRASLPPRPMESKNPARNSTRAWMSRKSSPTGFSAACANEPESRGFRKTRERDHLGRAMSLSEAGSSNNNFPGESHIHRALQGVEIASCDRLASSPTFKVGLVPGVSSQESKLDKVCTPATADLSRGDAFESQPRNQGWWVRAKSAVQVFGYKTPLGRKSVVRKSGRDKGVCTSGRPGVRSAARDDIDLRTNPKRGHET